MPIRKCVTYIEDTKRQLAIGSIDTDVVFGSPTNAGRTIIVEGDIKCGTRIKVYGWDLHVNGSIEDDVSIEYMPDFVGEDANRLCVYGNVGKKVSIKNVYELHIKGKIQDDTRIQAGRTIIAGDIGNHVQITSKVGPITCGDIGDCSLVKSDQGEFVKCNNVGKNSKVECHNAIMANNVAEKSKIKSHSGDISVNCAHSSVYINSRGKVTVKERTGEYTFCDFFRRCTLFSRHTTEDCKQTTVNKNFGFRKN